MYNNKGTTSNTGSSMQFNSSILHEGADKDNVISINIIEYQFYKFNEINNDNTDSRAGS